MIFPFHGYGRKGKHNQPLDFPNGPLAVKIENTTCRQVHPLGLVPIGKRLGFLENGTRFKNTHYIIKRLVKRGFSKYLCYAEIGRHATSVVQAIEVCGCSDEGGFLESPGRHGHGSRFKHSTRRPNLTVCFFCC